MARKSDLPRLRIIPSKLGAAFATAFFGLFLVGFTLSTFIDGGTVKSNGREVFGEEREEVLRSIRFMMAVPLVPFLCLFLFHARRLLPGSPFDFIEIGPDGLTIRGLFGRRHRRWHEITGFSSGQFVLSNPPIAWIKVESASPLRFTMGGYMKLKLFSFGKSEVQAIAEWLDMVRGAYTFGSDFLPPMPEALAGKIIPVSGENDAAPKHRSSVIER